MPAVHLDDLPDVGAVRCDVEGQAVAVVRAEDGTLHAIDDTCSHAEVSLSEGEVEDCAIECWLHGSRFDLRTGRPTGLPATQPVAVFALTVEDDVVLVPEVVAEVGGGDDGAEVGVLGARRTPPAGDLDPEPAEQPRGGPADAAGADDERP